MRISYSSLDTYKTCPLKFKFQQIDKIRAPKNIEMAFGSSVHAALKYMFERTPLYPTLDEVIDFFRNAWERQLEGVSEENGSLESKKDAYFREGASVLKNFYGKNPPWNFNTVELESFFSVELDDPETGKKHVLTGVMDRVDKNPEDESYEIIDYKTAKRMPPQSAVDSNLQLSIYHLGLVKRWPHLSSRKIKLSLFFLKHGEKVSTFRSRKQLEETAAEILGVIREIEEKASSENGFPPHPSALCDWCGYRKMCPMWKHLYGGTKAEKETEEEIKKAARDYFSLKEEERKNKERLGELKGRIFRFMDENGVERVFAGDVSVTRKFRETVSYDEEKVAKVLKEAGKLDGVLSLDPKKIESALPSLPPEVRRAVAEARTARTSASLSVSKAKGEEEEAPEE